MRITFFLFFLLTSFFIGCTNTNVRNSSESQFHTTTQTTLESSTTNSQTTKQTECYYALQVENETIGYTPYSTGS